MARRGLPPSTSVFPGFAGPATDAEELVSRLTDLRRRQGLSQTEVAARMGTSQSAVARLEAGGTDARLSTLARYVAALGTELGFVLRADATETTHHRPGGRP